MSERDDRSIDHELGGIAMAAIHEHELTVSSDEARAALEAVRSRVAGGDLGGAPPSIDLARGRRQRSPLVLLGAAAAVIAMFGLGLVAVIGERTNDTILSPITASDPGRATDPTATPTTTERVPAPVTTVSGVAPTLPVSPEPVAAGFVEQTIAVDAANPPPLVEPTVWQRVPIDAANVEQSVSVAVAADSVLVKQKNVQQVTFLGPGPDRTSTLDLDEDVDQIVAGPGPVFYGFGGPVFADDNAVAPRGFRFVAIAYDGPNAGRVVAVSEVDANRYLELPANSFGEGAEGVVDRDRDVGTTVIGYVDENGEPFDLEAASDDLGVVFPPVVPRFDDVDDDGFPDPGQRIVTPSDGRAWTLDIVRDPANGSTSTGWSAPRPTTGQRVIYTERIGAALDADDFARSALPVVAILNPDGSGQWIALPDDWDVVASDADGTILMRVTDTDFEFAYLGDALAAAGITTPQNPPVSAPATTLPDTEGNELVQPTAIVRTCAGEFIGCTQLASTQNGRIVGLDQVDARFRVYDSDGTELQAEVPIAEPLDAPHFWGMGPDDVAYVQTFPQGFGEAGSELRAIPLVGSNAGAVVMRWTGLDTSGDSTLIQRKAGLTSIGCCGRKETRPSPAATIYRWVDRNGATIESTAPSFDLNLGNAGNSLTRIDTQPDGSASFTNFTLPLAYQYPRDFPWVAATDDGGALAYDQLSAASGSVYVFVDFDTAWPGANVDNDDIYYQRDPEFFQLPLLETSGTVVVFVGGNDGQYERRTLGEVATRGWPGRTELVLDTFEVAAPGLNDYIAAEQPFWAADPELLAYQLAPAIGDSEEVRIEYDDTESPAITITTTGLLDDSVTATQTVVRTGRGSEGLLRFVSAATTFQCAPGRGHQDFSTELCI